MKEQIDIFDDLLIEFDEVGFLPTNFPHDHSEHYAIDWKKRLINAFEGYRKQSEWISVEDRLPESGAHCLLCCDLKCIDGTHRPYVCDGFHVERFSEQASGIDDYCITEYNEEDDEYYLIDGWYEIIKNWDDYGYIAIDDFVTHWMPLPEPPEMKGGAE